MSAAQSSVDNHIRTAIYQTARRNNPDLYLSALLSPRDVRDDLIALAAVTGEIDRIPLTVSDPMLAEIKLQWWQDWLEGLSSGEKTGNPNADALAQTIAHKNLDPSLLSAFIDATCEMLPAAPFETEQNYFDHIKTTDVTTFNLIAQILKLQTDQHLTDCLMEAGTAYGIARHLKSLRAHATHGRWPLPLSWSELGPRQDPPLYRRETAARQTAVKCALKKAHHALSSAKTACASAPSGTIDAALPAALVEPYLRGFEVHDGDPLMVPADISPLSRAWHLWWAYTRRAL